MDNVKITMVEKDFYNDSIEYDDHASIEGRLLPPCCPQAIPEVNQAIMGLVV